jgi:peptidoglycan/xylan/chitin deacetylase (PgdA/CDA1 family)
MVLVRELVTPLYRIGLYEKRRRRWWQPAPPVLEETAAHAPLTAAVASQVRWADPGARPSSDSPVLSRQVPILMYHGVSPDAGGALARYRLTPEQFEAQLRFLADQGYHSIGLESWRDAVEHRRNILGRPLIITFDDGFADFAEHAWPRLLHYGFGATLFVVSGHVGGTSAWDGDAARPLLDWGRLRQLRDQGLVIGAHSHRHAALTGLSVADIAREAARSRGAIAEALGEAVAAFAYPYGEHDPVVRHIVGACGFRFGLTVRNGLAGFGDDLLDLPRREIHSRLTMAQFEDLVRL